MCLPQPHPGHLEAFRQLGAQGELWRGRAIAPWAAAVVAPDGIQAYGLPDERLSRYELCELLQRLADDEAKLLAVCAWGGMRVGHGRLTWARRSGVEGHAPPPHTLMELIPLLPQMSRSECYAQFRALRLHALGLLPGMGPAYFTKLIHFLGPAGPRPGYILDQWTAKSINLLFGPLVFTSNGRVTERNTEVHYERYCRAVERLAAVLGVAAPSEVEHRLFARGPWRNYVKTHASQGVSDVLPLCEAELAAA